MANGRVSNSAHSRRTSAVNANLRMQAPTGSLAASSSTSTAASQSSSLTARKAKAGLPTPTALVVKATRPPVADNYCAFCSRDATYNELLSCATCGRYTICYPPRDLASTNDLIQSSGHPSCMQMNHNLAATCKTYPWQCMECKVCEECGKGGVSGPVIFEARLISEMSRRICELWPRYTWDPA